MRGRLLHDRGNWYEWRQDPPLRAGVLVRVEPGGDGRLSVAELRVTGTLTSELLRSIPLGRIEAAANAQLVDVGTGEVAARPATVRRTDARTRVERLDRGWDLAAGPPLRRRSGPRLPSRLRAANGRARADEFYVVVADIYRQLAQSSPRPAIDLADANQVPVTTAHRWIKEARRRGFLGPGRPGKAG